MYASLIVDFLQPFLKSPQNHCKREDFTLSFVAGRDTSKLLTAAYITEVHRDLFHEPISGPIQYLLLHMVL